MFKQHVNISLALITAAISPSVLLTLPVTAGEFSDGRTFFNHPPRLVRGATSTPATQFPSTYEFTLTVPTNAGEPLQAVTITQEAHATAVAFDLRKSVAFAGDRYQGGPILPLASIGGSQPEGAKDTTIVFDPPVQPGTTVTVALAAQRNPRIAGIYLFGVTAYPMGERGMGLFLGHSRLTFYNNSR